MKNRVLDLYAGCGGLSKGFLDAGYKIESAVEIDKWACETYQKNFPDTKVYKCSVKKYLKNHLDKKIDVIVGGPPCQGFSIAASNRRKENDSRNLEYRVFLGAIKKMHPKVVLFENVPEFIKFKNNRNEFLIDEMSRFLIDLGYFVSSQLINCANYGIPQIRKRFILIATKKNKFIFPEPKFSQQNDFFNQRFLNIWDAISDLPEVRPKQHKEDSILNYDTKPHNDFQKKMRLKSKKIFNHISMRHTDSTIEKFESYRKIKKVKKSFDQNHRIIDPQKPSPTITASFYSSFVHPFQNRNLTAREAARIQTFPDTFIFCGKKTTLSKSLLKRKGIKEELFLDQFNQIGNSVPVMIAEILAMEIKTYL